LCKPGVYTLLAQSATPTRLNDFSVVEGLTVNESAAYHPDSQLWMRM